MKFAVIVLLGLCVLSAQSSPVDFETYDESIGRNGFTEEIQKVVEEALRRASQKFEEVREKLKEVSESVHERLHELLEEGQQKLTEMIAKIQDKVAEMKQKGGVLEQCAVKYENELAEIREVTKADLQKCAQKVVVAVQEYQKSVEHDIAQIKENIKEFRDLVEECMGQENPIAIGSCAFEKLNEFKNVISEIVSAAKEATQIAVQKGTEAVKDVEKCNQDAAVIAYNKVQGVVAKIQQCYAESQKQ